MNTTNSPTVSTPPTAAGSAVDPKLSAAETNRLAKQKILDAQIAEREAIEKREQSQQLASRLRIEIDRLQDEARQAATLAGAATKQEELARLQARDAAREMMPEPVTLVIAENMAVQLLSAFDATSSRDNENRDRQLAEKPPIDVQASKLWALIDDIRCRLLTHEIDENAQMLVMAIEGVIFGCDSWETHRMSIMRNQKNNDGTPLANIRSFALPQSSRLVSSLLDELKLVLTGQEPPPAIESLGTLIGEQNVSPIQAARMYGLILADGSPDLATLGAIIDRALGRVGFYAEISKWRFLKRSAAMNLEQAWAIRQSDISNRRSRSHRLPGSAQLAGEYREGRDTNLPREEEGHLLDEQQLRQHRLARFRKARVS